MSNSQKLYELEVEVQAHDVYLIPADSLEDAIGKFGAGEHEKPAFTKMDDVEVVSARLAKYRGKG